MSPFPLESFTTLFARSTRHVLYRWEYSQKFRMRSDFPSGSRIQPLLDSEMARKIGGSRTERAIGKSLEGADSKAWPAECAPNPDFARSSTPLIE